MDKYKVLWVKPKEPEWETHSSDMSRDEAWSTCQELWENGYSDAMVTPEDEPDSAKTAALWVRNNCRMCAAGQFTV